MNDTDRCLAVIGDADHRSTMIDLINPDTGRTRIYGRTVADAQREYPGAEEMTVEEYCARKAALQDTPIEWLPITEEKYNYYLEVLPPLDYRNRGFLVSEPIDGHAATGAYRYLAVRTEYPKFYVSSRPVTRTEWAQLTTTKEIL